MRHHHPEQGQLVLIRLPRDGPPFSVYYEHRRYTAAMLAARSAKQRRRLWDDLLLALAADLVRSRPARYEPRAVKRRPKPFPLLTKLRHEFKEIAHRNRHWESKPRTYRQNP